MIVLETHIILSILLPDTRARLHICSLM